MTDEAKPESPFTATAPPPDIDSDALARAIAMHIPKGALWAIAVYMPRDADTRGCLALGNCPPEVIQSVLTLGAMGIAMHGDEARPLHHPSRDS